MMILFTGCSTTDLEKNERLIPQVAFDYNCPQENVKIIFFDEGGYNHPTAVVEVCGVRRRYRDMGSSHFIFVEVGTRECKP